MRKLHGIAEVHNDSKKKVEDVRCLLERIKPNIFYIEGTKGEYGNFMKEVGYRGQVVFLDEGYDALENMQKKMRDAHGNYRETDKKFKNEMKKFKRLENIESLVNSLPDPLKRLALPFYKKTLSRAKDYAYEKTEKKYYELASDMINVSKNTQESIRDMCIMNQIERERYWAKNITKTFREPAVILTGKAHQIKFIDNVGKLPDILREKGIELQVEYDEPWHYQNQSHIHSISI